MHLRKIVIAVLMFFTSINTFAKETLIFAFDIVHHGDRTPELVIPKSNYQWKEGVGQLTARGMQQAFQLGTFFRKKYVYKHHLLPEHYQNGTILVFSTDCNRTLMSAQSMLLGLYPIGTGPLLAKGKSALPGGYQPIPIHIRDSAAENGKKKHRQLVTQHVTSNPEQKEKIIQLKGKFERWSLATGLTITTIKQLKELADALHIYMLYHVPMPTGLSEKDVKEIIALGQQEEINKYQTKKVASFLGQPMLAKISDVLQKASLQETALRYILLSNHDVTIASVMTMLQNPLDEMPPYVAYINFALFKTDSGNYLVKISYNGKPVIIPGCGTRNCTLKQFVEFISNAGG